MIGVCIKYFHENYGGMLQAFATVKMLESRGIDYELIRYKKKLTIAEKVRSMGTGIEFAKSVDSADGTI